MTFKSQVGPMTREEAFQFAQWLWGKDAMVGLNHNFHKQHHVGVIVNFGLWAKRGVGCSWEEAFLDVRDWPDGYPPKRLLKSDAQSV